jgi:hypothetical protein
MQSVVNKVFEYYKNVFKPKKAFVLAMLSFGWLKIILKNTSMLLRLLVTVALTWA